MSAFPPPAVAAVLGFRHPMEAVAWWCAMTSLAFSLVATGIAWRFPARIEADLPLPPRQAVLRSLHSVPTALALLAASVSAALLLFSLGTRLLDFVVELMHVEPRVVQPRYAFGPSGLESLAALGVAGAVLMRSRRDVRLAGGLLAMAGLLLVWFCLLGPVYEASPAGGVQFTGRSFAFLFGGSALVASAVGIIGWAERRRRWQGAIRDPDSLARPLPARPGVAWVLRVLALLVLAMAGYHLAVPLPCAWGRDRWLVFLMSVANGVCAGSCFVWVSRRWDAGLADIALGLSSLALAGLAVSVSFSPWATMAERYPIVFNAMMVGLTVASALWTWLYGFWQQQLDQGWAWTPAGRLISPVRRFAFFNLLFALGLGADMALWPRLHSIATPDFSLGRVMAGFGAHLFLLLVSLWSARRMKTKPFHWLPLLVLVSTVGFLVIRMLPYTPRFG